jgi:hypothetical protein
LIFFFFFILYLVFARAVQNERNQDFHGVLAEDRIGKTLGSSKAAFDLFLFLLPFSAPTAERNTKKLAMMGFLFGSHATATVSTTFCLPRWEWGPGRSGTAHPMRELTGIIPDAGIDLVQALARCQVGTSDVGTLGNFPRQSPRANPVAGLVERPSHAASPDSTPRMSLVSKRGIHFVRETGSNSRRVRH